MTVHTGRITVVGLGTGDADQLTLGVWRKLQQAKRIYLRTDQHPMIHMLKENNIAYESFDAEYEKNASFEEVYEIIANDLIHQATERPDEEVIYAVPGHPMVAEYTVQLLRKRCPELGIELTITGGESFLDQTFTRFGFDPIDGFQLLDATSMTPGMLNTQTHIIIGQVYDVYTASDAKLTLMERYPDDYQVTVGHALGVMGQEKIVTVPIYELDRIQDYGNLSLIWVPRSDNEIVKARSFERLHEIVAILRSPGGCPWDRDQTHASIRNNLIEETYEVLETIDDDDPDAMCEELGDLLLQVMFHSQIEEETGAFSIYDVIQAINEKLIRRHPHVFGDRDANNAEEALANWDGIKAEEKRMKGIEPEEQSILAGIPRDLPGILKAWKLQKKAAKVGFDWPSALDVLDKVQEELAEVREAIESGNEPEQLEELGDLLFVIVNVARKLRIDPEEALIAATRKFTNRFHYVEQGLRAKGKSFDETDIIEMEALWQEAKKVLKP
ncbi:nucleoside triphosphate pyrophosphohydrolase [Paenibacillus sp. N1-5-1-14]|uniref:nucleoside triphosphate pyrophosphohydrolase n=1 Tax=Paenibacillus radicibacter TaxID=2972488 RepID=UPI002159628F|nr:nucleoside triphosphate pyrophosphohydrolase [Paenibacillus radicibacter]MCR8645861.1 nucleoside triphosphate pyrophosphohydrolase [Paenibacillus radicibacter]